MDLSLDVPWQFEVVHLCLCGLCALPFLLLQNYSSASSAVYQLSSLIRFFQGQNPLWAAFVTGWCCCLMGVLHLWCIDDAMNAIQIAW